MSPRSRAPVRSRFAAATASLAAAMLVLAAVTGSVWAAFTNQSSNAGNQLAAAADYRAPTAASSVIQKTEGGTAGYIRQGGTYRVYASVTDAGNPATGISAVTGNLSSISTAQTAAALGSGSFTIGGSSYNYDSSALTANSVLSAGTSSYTLTSTDSAANSRTQSGYSVVVDNTQPTSSDISTANGSFTIGKPEQNDSVTFTYTEPIEPGKILSGWSGAATNVVLRLNDGGVSNDTVTIYNSTNVTQLPLGSVSLGRTDYIGTSRTFGASGTPSSMTMSGNAVTVVLGSASGSVATAGGTGTMIWTRSTTPTDRAGNSVASGTFSETGTADREF
jgi:hypothetical protein